jgi:hypothetical protein
VADPKKFTFTLDKLHRVLDRLEGGPTLRKHRYLGMESQDVAQVVTQDPGLLLAGTHGAYVEAKQQELERARKAWALQQTKRMVVILLKSKLFTANVESGVHERLTNLSMYQSQVSHLEGWAKSTQPGWLTPEQFQAVKARQEKGEGANFAFSIIPVIPWGSPEEARVQLQGFLKDIDRLRDEVADINRTWKVEVEVDEEVAAELGLA